MQVKEIIRVSLFEKRAVSSERFHFILLGEPVIMLSIMKCNWLKIRKIR